MRTRHEAESVSGVTAMPHVDLWTSCNALLHRSQTQAAQHHWVSNPALHFPNVYDNALRDAFRRQRRWETHAATLGDSNETQFQTLKCVHFQWKAAQKHAEGVRSQTELMCALEKHNCSFRLANYFQSWRSAKSAEPRYRFLSLKFSSPTPQCVRCATWSRSLAELQSAMPHVGLWKSCNALLHVY